MAQKAQAHSVVLPGLIYTDERHNDASEQWHSAEVHVSSCRRCVQNPSSLSGAALSRHVPPCTSSCSRVLRRHGELPPRCWRCKCPRCRDGWRTYSCKLCSWCCNLHRPTSSSHCHRPTRGSSSLYRSTSRSLYRPTSSLHRRTRFRSMLHGIAATAARHRRHITSWWGLAPCRMRRGLSRIATTASMRWREAALGDWSGGPSRHQMSRGYRCPLCFAG